MGQDLRKELVTATIISVPDGVEDMAARVQCLGKTSEEYRHGIIKSFGEYPQRPHELLQKSS
jgi:hypothetical protein